MPAEERSLSREIRLPADPRASHVPSRSTESVPRMSLAGLDEPFPPQGMPYRLKEVIGRGGMGEVWEAVQASLGRTVAVKRVAKQATPDETARRQREFRVEAVVAARLEHPNIVPVHDLTVDESGAPIMAMKMVQGVMWDHLLEGDFGIFSPEELLGHHLPILVSLSQAVAFAHSKGIVHRDLKPAQVMVGQFGEALLMDWGLALALPGAVRDAPIAIPGPATAESPAGTPAMMAPEQTMPTAEGVGPWTDVFLLGGTLYYMLTGHYPFDAETSAEAFRKAESGRVEPPRERAPGRFIPPELEELAMAALSPRAKERLPSAHLFLVRLQDYLSGTTRKREAAAILADAKEALAAAGASYAALGAVRMAIAKAQALAPASPDARLLAEAAAAAHAHAALRHGDLVLAESIVEQMQEGAARQRLAADIAEGRARARRRDQWRLVGVWALALAPVMAMLFGLLQYRNQLQQSVAESNRLKAEMESADRTRLARLFREAGRVAAQESAFARRAMAELPLPHALRADGDGAMRERARALLAEAAALKARRAELAGGEAASVSSGAPAEFALAEALAMLHAAEDAAGNAAAWRAFRSAEASDTARIGMGIAAARAGESTSATLELGNALERALAASGAAHPDTVLAAMLLAQAGGGGGRAGAVLGEHAAEVSAAMARMAAAEGNDESALMALEAALPLAGASSRARIAQQAREFASRLDSRHRDAEAAFLRRDFAGALAACEGLRRAPWPDRRAVLHALLGNDDAAMAEAQSHAVKAAIALAGPKDVRARPALRDGVDALDASGPGAWSEATRLGWIAGARNAANAAEWQALAENPDWRGAVRERIDRDGVRTRLDDDRPLFGAAMPPAQPMGADAWAAVADDAAVELLVLVPAPRADGEIRLALASGGEIPLQLKAQEAAGAVYWGKCAAGRLRRGFAADGESLAWPWRLPATLNTRVWKAADGVVITARRGVE